LQPFFIFRYQMSNRLIVPPLDDSLQCFQKINQVCYKNWQRLKIEKKPSNPSQYMVMTLYFGVMA